MKRIFIIGVEGSGTTMLSRILGEQPNSVSILGNYISERIKSDAYALKLVQQLTMQTQNLWDIDGNLDDYIGAKKAIPDIIEKLELYLSAKHNVTHFVYKRSSPFLSGNRYIPDILDVLELFKDPSVIVMLRDPKQSSYSALRRGFLSNIKQCAIVCHINLTLLMSVIKCLERILVINYNDFCEDHNRFIQQISEVLEIKSDILIESIHKEKLNTSNHKRYLKELDSKSIEFLDNYFDSRRVKTYSVFS